MIVIPDVITHVIGFLQAVDGSELEEISVGIAVVVSLVGHFLASFFAAKHIPVCWPDGYRDYRPILLVISLGLLLAPPPLPGLAVFLLVALASGHLLGSGIKRRKLRIERWAERPKQISRKEHKVADKLQDGVEYLIFNIGIGYQMSDEATVDGLEKIKEQARSMAREYFALTGHSIEARIDGFLSTTWITRREIVEGTKRA